MTVITAQSLLADLGRLLPPDQLMRAEVAVRETAPPSRIVPVLVTSGLLTRFQAEAIARGQALRLVFGPYVLLDKIGDGGMGCVYKARHARLDRIDAVKVIRADKIASKIAAKRFLREIRLTSSLQHPHIVRAYDAGTVDGQLYLATEYVKGKNLAAAVLKTGPLSVADACHAAYQTALALQHVHENNLVHRDVKPSNLLRDDATGVVKLLDLGLSNVSQEDEGENGTGTLTRDGVLLGTPDFMAPEQAQSPHSVDIRADLYGLGCTLYFLLSGKPPFEGTSVEKLLKHAFDPPPPLVLPSGTTPPALAALVARLMAKNPADRYPDPKALTQALLALRPGGTPTPMAGETENDFVNLTAPAAPVTGGSSRRLAVEADRRMKWWAVGLGAAVAASGLLLAFALGAFRSPRPPATAPSTTDEVTDELRDLRRAVTYPGEDRAALRRRLTEFRGRTLGTPNAVAAAQLLRRLPSVLDALPASPEPLPGTVAVEALAFAPSDDRVFAARPGVPPQEWDVFGRAESGRFGLPELTFDRAASVSADGSVAGVSADGKVVVGGRGKPRAFDLGPAVRRAVLAPDGKSVVAVFDDAEERIAVVDFETGRVTARLDQRSIGVVAVNLSPDGALVAVSAADNAVRLFQAATGKKLNAFDPDPAFGGRPLAVFSPDGQKVYATGLSTGVARYAVGGRIAEAVYALPELPDDRPANRWRKPSPGDRVTCLAVGPDGTALALGTSQGEVRVFQVPTGRPTHDQRLPGRVTALAFSTDGRALAAATGDGAIHLFGAK